MLMRSCLTGCKSKRVLLRSNFLGDIFLADHHHICTRIINPCVWYRIKKYSTKPKTIKDIDLSQFPEKNIRNFSIIAHIDHGKSTLADRLLEVTGVIPESQKNAQVLDKLQVERERGITVKAQSASLFYDYEGTTYLLNLVDTPGHVDFSFEVSRSLSACEGVILLIDANQGVQAQTVANMYLAIEKGLEIIPVLNKIDLKGAKPQLVTEQIMNLYPFAEEDILKVSAKLGMGIDELLQAIIKRIPSPNGDSNKPLQGLVYDSWFDQFKGLICNIAVKNGKITRGDKIAFYHTKKSFEVQDVGILYPEQTPTGILYAGQVGYISANIKSSNDTLVGDTVHLKDKQTEPLSGFKPAKPMVFAGIFPDDQSQHTALKDAIKKLTFNDSSVSVFTDSSAVLGQGWRLGFLGLLHMDVFKLRLEQEFDASLVITSPNIPYKVKILGAKNIKEYKGEEVMVLNPCMMPDQSIISNYYEPMVLSTIIFPDTCLGAVTPLILDRRGVIEKEEYIDNSRIMAKVTFPLNEILVDFFDELKSVTSGYGSFDYEDKGYQETDLVKIDFTINERQMEEMAMLMHPSKAVATAKKICLRLKENIPRQQFSIKIQAMINKKKVCSQEIKQYRKDVTAKLYGGDVTRKNKLLAKQAAGKKKMRQIGNISVPKEVFINVLKK